MILRGSATFSRMRASTALSRVRTGFFFGKPEIVDADVLVRIVPRNHITRVGPCGGTGRRDRLKIGFRKECWFESGQGHHSR